MKWSEREKRKEKKERKKKIQFISCWPCLQWKYKRYNMTDFYITWSSSLLDLTIFEKFIDIIIIEWNILERSEDDQVESIFVLRSQLSVNMLCVRFSPTWSCQHAQRSMLELMHERCWQCAAGYLILFGWCFQSSCWRSKFNVAYIIFIQIDVEFL